MTDNIPYPQRKQIRLKQYDYTSDGAYHVTVCTEGKRKLLSHVVPPVDALSPLQLNLTQIGSMTETVIQDFAKRYSYIQIPEYCIMPNHIHLLIVYRGKDEPGTKRLSLSSLISQFKGQVCKAIGQKIWQRGYYEHIIRGEEDYWETVKYIRENPAKWAQDDYFMPG